MTQLCFGGSFNPIHIGHLIVSRAVAESLNLNGVLLIPSAQPPHKASADLASVQHRHRMCQLVAQSDPFFQVDDIELRRSGPSYTLDTVLELKRRGWAEVHWMIGADMVRILPKWHRPLELMKEARLWIACRPGYALEWQSLPSEYRDLQRQVVSAPDIELSASAIRERIGKALSIRYLVTDEVGEYIAMQRLYAKEA